MCRNLSFFSVYNVRSKQLKKIPSHTFLDIAK